ncbi:MAG: M15 family metallopeptidase [Spirochaetota bacterium]
MTTPHGLVDLSLACPEVRVDMRYATDRNFFKARLYDGDRAWLLEPTARKLSQAASLAAVRGLLIVVLDAYRPLAVQDLMWRMLPDPAFVAPSSRGSIHNRGAAVDVTLAYEDGSPVAMPSEFDDFSERASHGYRGTGTGTLEGRDFLRVCMESAGFKAYDAEWWHYTDPETRNYPLLNLSLSQLVAVEEGSMYRTGFIDLRAGDFSGWSLGDGVCIQPEDGSLSLSRTAMAQADQALQATLADQVDQVAQAALAGQVDSPVLETSFAFSAAIPSWSADTPDGSWLEVLIRARCADLWSRWFSMGIWASGNSTVQRHSIAGQKDAGARLDTDTLRLEVPADALQIRIRLFSKDDRTLPSLRRVCVAYSDPKPVAAPAAKATATMMPDKMGEPARADVAAGQASWSGELAGVPRCSQMVYPDGGKLWCSPTCVAMILSYWRKASGACEAGIRKTVAGTHDCVYGGNGNWAFNTAYAVAEGFEACVARFSSLAQLEPWLAAGVPVALSISWNNDEGRVLSGAPLSSSSGHLTLLVGFNAAGNPIMHEPASPDNGSVRRIYRRAELRERWLTASGGACYLIHPRGHSVPPLPGIQHAAENRIHDCSTAC